MTLVLIALLGVLFAGGVGAGIFIAAQRVQADQQRASELIPGQPSSAPASWAGSHDPEALLHRRLRDALAALRANRDFDDDGSLLPLRVDLELQARALDEQLVAVAALPAPQRAEPLATVERSVQGIEQAVAEVAGMSAAQAGARVQRVLDEVGSSTGVLAQTRAALDELDAADAAQPPPPATGARPATEPGLGEEPGTSASGSAF